MLLSTPAAAADVGLLGVHDGALDPAGQRALSRALAEVLEGAGHTVVLPEAIAQRIAGQEQDVLARALQFDGRRAVEQGTALLETGDAAAAERQFELGIAALRRSARYVLNVDALWEAHVALAESRLAQGDEMGARDALASAIALLPELAPVEASEALADLWEDEALAGADEGSRVRVSVAGRTGASGWVDGRPVGELPQEVPNLLPGWHALVARGEDGTYAARGVEVGADRAAPSPLQLGVPRVDDDALTDGERSQRTATIYSAIGNHADLDAVVLVGRVGGRPTVQWLDTASGMFSEPCTGHGTGGSEWTTALERCATGTQPSAPAALPLALADNLVLGALLVHPTAQAPLPTLADAPPSELMAERQATPSSTAPAARTVRWPVWVGVGLGVVAAAGLGLGLGVGLSPGAQGPVSGTIVVRAP